MLSRSLITIFTATALVAAAANAQSTRRSVPIGGPGTLDTLPPPTPSPFAYQGFRTGVPLSEALANFSSPYGRTNKEACERVPKQPSLRYCTYGSMQGRPGSAPVELYATIDAADSVVLAAKVFLHRPPQIAERTVSTQLATGWGQPDSVATDDWAYWSDTGRRAAVLTSGGSTNTHILFLEDAPFLEARLVAHRDPETLRLIAARRAKAAAKAAAAARAASDSARAMGSFRP